MARRARWQQVALAASFLAILAAYALPFVQLTALIRVDTLTGIDLVMFRAASPTSLPADEFERRWGEGYELMMGEGYLARAAMRAEDEELARELPATGPSRLSSPRRR